MDEREKWKDNVMFLLVEPVEQGNIGASARAIKNMGFNRLGLVNPKAEPGLEAAWFAHRAGEVLGRVRTFETLKDAVRDHAFVLGATRRKGKNRGANIPLAEAIARLRSAAERNRVAVVFGRETRGLYNDETEECSFLTSIPATNPEHPSLNLSHAVLLMAYELAKTSAPADACPVLALNLDMDSFHAKVGEIFDILGHTRRGDRMVGRNYMAAIKHITGRSMLTPRELKLLSGILTQVKTILKPER